MFLFRCGLHAVLAEPGTVVGLLAFSVTAKGRLWVRAWRMRRKGTRKVLGGSHRRAIGAHPTPDLRVCGRKYRVFITHGGLEGNGIWNAPAVQTRVFGALLTAEKPIEWGGLDKVKGLNVESTSRLPVA